MGLRGSRPNIWATSLRREVDYGTRNSIAKIWRIVAAAMDHRSGRAWRNLQDTADSAALLYYTLTDWDSWRRSVDYYEEGELDWLWADSIIRQQTGGKKSIIILQTFPRRTQHPAHGENLHLR